MNQDELIKKYEIEFNKFRESRGFKSTLEDLEEIFFIKDFILREKFVSPTINRTICARIVDLFSNWNSYLHSLLMPNPSSMPNMEESKTVSEEDKKEILKIMSQIMEFASKNTLIGLSKNIKEEGEFIDESVDFWNNVLKPNNIKILTKVNNNWTKKAKGEEEAPKNNDFSYSG